jgi:hypothetical protein
MAPPRIASRQPTAWFLCFSPGAGDWRIHSGGWKRAMVVTALAALIAVLALPQPAHAWRYGWGFNPGGPGGYPWTPAPQVVFPFQRPRHYRYSIPPGAPLSFDDPGSGATYCLSQTTGFYFVCAYAPPSAISIGPVVPTPSSLVPPVSEPTAPPASGVLLFRLSGGTAVTVNGVPIGLSNGLGIHALPPGRYLVVLHVSGKETEHTVDVRSHKIFTVTPTGIVPTEP